jgi:hypothetical protein
MAFVRRHLERASCMDCGEDDPRVLEFDHVEGKLADVSYLVQAGASPEVLQAEIDRCEVVCANCHRRRTLARLRAARGRNYEWNLKRGGIGRKLAYVRRRLAESGCVDCGETDPGVLEFDHVRGKLASVSGLGWANASDLRIDEEIARCEVRCVNCHRIRTASQFGHARHHWDLREAA